MSKEPSPVDWPNRGRPPEDPDGLLRAFFRAELPAPWPGFRRPGGLAPAVTANGQAPAAEPAPRRPWPALRPAWRRRLGLAAAASVLLAGTLLLSGQFRTSPVEAPTGPGIANPKLPRDVIIQESLIQDGEQPTKVMIDIYAP